MCTCTDDTRDADEAAAERRTPAGDSRRDTNLGQQGVRNTSPEVVGGATALQDADERERVLVLVGNIPPTTDPARALPVIQREFARFGLTAPPRVRG